jgi:hypothetical protein
LAIGDDGQQRRVNARRALRSPVMIAPGMIAVVCLFGGCSDDANPADPSVVDSPNGTGVVDDGGAGDTVLPPSMAPQATEAPNPNAGGGGGGGAGVATSAP